MNRNYIFYIVITFAWMSAGPAYSEPPSFTPLGDLPNGAFFSGAAGVSADGSIVVGTGSSNCVQPNLCNSEAFRWQAGTMTGLGFPPTTYAVPYSNGSAVSADGSIIAGSASSNYGTNEPFRWEGGAFTPLGRIPGYGNNAHLSTGISDDGSRIVGWGYSSNGLGSQGWLWENGTMIGLGNLSPGSPGSSTANGISGDGNVIVGGSDGSNGSEAFRWFDGTMTGLGFLPSPFSNPNGDLIFVSWASSASYDGSVIVGASRTFDYESLDQTEAFRWSDGVMTGLGDLAGGAFGSYATAVSADGTIIVGQGSTNTGETAFIWDSLHGMRDLREVLEINLGLNLAGWTHLFVNDISADGDVIVGMGINPDGDYEAFRAVIPEPTTLLLLLLGIFIVGQVYPKQRCNPLEADSAIRRTSRPSRR